MTSWACLSLVFPEQTYEESRDAVILEHCAFQKDFPGLSGYKGMLRGAKPAPSPGAFGLGTAALAADSG